MKEENNIDNLFREKLDGFSEDPPVYIWDGIQEHLAMGRRKKRIVWYSWSAVAALLVLAFLAGWYFNETSERVIPHVAETELLNAAGEKRQPAEESDTETLNEEINPVTEERTQEMAVEEDDRKIPVETAPVGKKMLAEATAAAADAREEILPPERIEPVEAVINENIGEVADISKPATEGVQDLSVFEKETISRNVAQLAGTGEQVAGWKMGVNISPGYSSYSASHGETYASNMTQDAAGGNANLSGGVSFRYRTNKRWSVETGVYYAQNGQQSGSSPQMFAQRAEADNAMAPTERLYFNTAVKMEESRIAMNSTAGVIEFANLPAGAEIAANLETADSYGNSLITRGELSQVFDLVEVPLYLRYLLVESKLDIELMGGFNAGMIVGNNAFIDNQYGVQKIGKTRDISTVNLSGTVGLGFSYALNHHFSLALEPRFNYYMNSISTNPEVDFRPYRIGVYTGVYYAF